MAGTRQPARVSDSLWLGGGCVLLCTLLCSLALQSILESSLLAGQFISHGLWRDLVGLLAGGNQPSISPDGLAAEISYGRIALLNLGGGLMCWLLGAWLISRRSGRTFSLALGHWGVRGWLWGLIPFLWEISRIIAAGFGQDNSLQTFLQATAQLWMAMALAGWLATLASLMQNPAPATSLVADRKLNRAAFWGVVLAVLIYVVVFTAMNWQLYRNLLVPHGDSAMYEEHLWNFTHGKGFRSYLEDRLFLGEHLQVVHLLLLPLYIFWPSLMLMDLCESFALASAAIPIFWMTRRHTKSNKAGLLVAVGYLLYFPMQYVDIAIDLKTFRPIAFGIPAMLYGLDQLERGRLKSAITCWVIALSAKEDYAIILAPLGLWIALFPTATRKPELATRKTRWLGLTIAVCSTLYLALAVKYIIPSFRGGEQVHYVGYFQRFGSTLEEVVKNILGNPKLLFSELFAVTTPIYAVSLLIPLGMMALFSPSRLLAGLPLFGLLCLNQIARTPVHHFHAPLIPILLWATAAGVARFPCISWKSSEPKPSSQWAAWFVLTSAFATGLFASISPLGIGFWDQNSSAYWKGRYLIGERAKSSQLFWMRSPAPPAYSPRISHIPASRISPGLTITVPTLAKPTKNSHTPNPA